MTVKASRVGIHTLPDRSTGTYTCARHGGVMPIGRHIPAGRICPDCREVENPSTAATIRGLVADGWEVEEVARMLDVPLRRVRRALSDGRRLGK